MTTVIETKNLVRIFGKDETMVTALDHVNVTIEEGEFTAIIGPSGSGKTTLLQLIGGLDEPDEGDVFLSGTNIANMSGTQLSDFRRDHIGFIFQSYNLIPVLPAEENIEYIMLIQGIPQQQRKDRVKEMLALVGLEGLGDRRPAQLSGGQQQRVAIARALVNRPNILLADEPTGALDSETSNEIMELFTDLNKNGVTVIIVTHEQEIADWTHRVLRLRDGAIVADEYIKEMPHVVSG